MTNADRFADFVRAPNITADPDLYDLENAAIRRNGRLDAALRSIGDWRGRRLLDIGCGTGFWLRDYAEADEVIGVEPDPDLIVMADRRVADLASVSVRPGSAEHLPVEDASIEVAHARFAYFFGEGAEQGLAEVRRVLAPDGVFVAIDNDWSWGEFADLLRAASGGNAAVDPGAVRRWWTAQGAERIDIRAGWDARSPDELERLLRLEFADHVVDRFIRRRSPASTLTYGISMFVVRA